MIRLKHVLYGLILVLSFFVSSTFAILDTIVLQHGVDEYYGNKDAHRVGKGGESLLLVGSCWAGGPNNEVRAASRFDLEGINFITGVVSATASYYYFEEYGASAGVQVVDLGMAFMDKLLSSEYITDLDIGSPDFDIVENLASDTGWVNFALPASDMENLFAGTMENKGFAIRGIDQIYGKPYYKKFHSREYSVVSERPKLTIIYDMAEHVIFFAPIKAQKIRPTEVNNIVWYSNSTGNFKIELLKGGVVVDLIAENISASPYAWKFDQHKYSSGIDYSIRITSSGAVSSNEPVFEIVSFLPALAVTNGTGSGTYSVNEAVSIAGTNSDTYFYQFNNWSGDIQYLSDINSESTSVNMPDTDVVVIANYVRALINIPGNIKPNAYVDTVGRWSYVAGYLRSYTRQKDDYLVYSVIVNKSGSYVISPKYAMASKSSDSLFYNFTNLNSGDQFSHGTIDTNAMGVWEPRNSIIDTVFLKKGEYSYKLNFDLYNSYSEISRLHIYDITFSLVTEGSVLVVENGSGDGLYSEGTEVSVTAETPPNGGTFSRWESESGLVFASYSLQTTTVTMGAGDCIVRAVYEGGSIAVNSTNKIIPTSLYGVLQNGYLKFTFGGGVSTGNFDLKIFNLMGKLVYSESKNIVKNKTLLVPVSTFSNGVYMVRGKYLGKMVTQKIVISK